VQRGDNLSIIARRFGVSVENIKRWNGLNGNLIYPGQDLSIN
jgi:LysM repeat protein